MDLFWYRATTLAERHAQGKSCGLQAVDAKTPRRVDRWRSQFASESLFLERLAGGGLDEEVFVQLLSEKPAAIRRRFDGPPEWVTAIRNALAHTPETDPLGPEIRTSPVLGLLAPFRGPLAIARERVRGSLERIASRWDDLHIEPRRFEELLVSGLLWQLLSLAGRTMVLELNVARVQGSLAGGTPEERFSNFVQLLRRPDVLRQFIEEYPVLMRDVARTIDQWAVTSVEWAERLSVDFRDICREIFSGMHPGDVMEFHCGAGDTHDGGRSVGIVTFASGRRVVYKPRSLAIDVHFQQLLGWLNDRGLRPEFRPLAIIDRGDYGWTEYIDSAPSETTEAVARFHQRQGAYLALLYALDATDFHFENLKAAGENPFLLDLEALFHPRLAGANLRLADIDDSVLRTGLLPNSESLDLSGLSDAEGQVMPHDVTACERVGTDEMRFVSRKVALSGTQNRPTLNGARVNAAGYADALETGFRDAYRILLENREELLSPAGPLARFADDRIRIIFRSTRFYALLHEAAHHPDALRDALDRDRVFDYLWTTVGDAPYLKQVLPAERRDLENGDIPLFTATPGGVEVQTSTGERLTGLLSQSGLDGVRAKIRRMSDQDLDRQLWFIRASLSSLAGGTERPAASVRKPAATHDVEPRDLIRAAELIGERLGQLAFRRGADATWLGVTLAGDRRWSLNPAGWELYDGLSGIALFLAYLGEVSGDASHTELASAALETCLQAAGVQQTVSIGVFGGLSGLLYVLPHFASLWNTPSIVQKAPPLLDLLDRSIDTDDNLDLIGGAAGCILALLRLYRSLPSERVLAMAKRCGDRLLAHAGPGWTNRIKSTRPLTGLSHGAAGISWALLELSAVTADLRYRRAALAGIDYERSVYSEEQRNWPDFRTADDGATVEPAYVCAWCHGAAGIGLARLQCLRHCDDSRTRKEIDAAVATTLAAGAGESHCLCHGELGNLELLLSSGRAFGDGELVVKAKRMAGSIVLDARDSGWVCGNPLRVESPGLMTGLAGIGYGLLRMAAPARVPSVLMLEPPVSAASSHEKPAVLAAVARGRS
jgi:type 2 lantibiotic biosynthesis protein LanM